ncbi:MAG TPA: PAS domain S-box protein, partial [Pyrinomonadaceae bacterium]|nr:PAS domain S-box protein [Pyrinomonadaceae bacterium]
QLTLIAPVNALKNDPHLLTSLVDASVDGILAFDREYRYTAWNKAMERISGVNCADVLGKYAFEVFPFLKENGEDKYFREALAGRSAISENRPYTVPETGREGFFEGHYSPLFGDDGKVVGGISVVRDITERKRADEEIRNAHQRLTFHVENSPLAVIEWDSDFRLSRWSDSAERLFGWQAEEVLGKHVADWQFVFAEDLSSVAQLTNKQREGFERQGVLRNRNYTKDGSILHCEWYNSVLNDDAGKLVSVLSLVLDVTARKLAEEELAKLLVRERQARREAEDADRLKDEFLATLSHELRTPLTSVLGWASLIRAGEISEANYAVGLETIERNARLQARLIDDLLDVSRIITGNLRLELNPIDLATVVEAARDTVRPAAEAKGIEIQTAFATEACIIKGDPSRLRQVVWNLLLNAIKFTPQGGRVSVALHCVNSAVLLTVSDSGEGIEAQFLPHAFDRFRQAEGSMSRRQGGLGLGLAVVRHLVELHGGNVTVESPGKGLGATFTVELPRGPGLKESRANVGQDEGQEVHTDDTRQTDARHRRGNAIRLDGLRVLVVEDDADARSLITTMLERSGAQATLASSAAEALQAIEGATPDVVVSDIGMPDEDGYELIRRVRALPPERGGLTPAIALTGYATAKDRERAMAAGYQAHIAKPIEQAELLTAIANLVKAEASKPVMSDE